MNFDNLQFHPLANEFQLLEGEELKELAADMDKGWIEDERIVHPRGVKQRGDGRRRSFKQALLKTE
jgi:hypothetical protein